MPPVAVVAQGNPNFQSEEVITYEAGYRTTFSKSVSLDVTGFYNDYRDLRYCQCRELRFLMEHPCDRAFKFYQRPEG